ncbi:GRP family sugar transporter [Leadbetterella byssophila]|jgi:glucose uptake protein|uniref:Sugar transport family protein n=1 Tax=Leadbetterella byssophila (strain DSM 17132 / JCM 16389 / KACC 11308 / NBRC 106382 / 4M15) TaxID=649349 RepID=E4RW08_LEAB4|nr:GRP family sugar transporter [Leadbetterella byssophila]ADQ16151.1 sugar transport family protein [Leadbetterella byssophila DSM 17132]
MFIVDNYALAVVFCVITMICWGSWGNTQKLAGKSWRYELFYWDYVIGILLFSLISAFTLGSMGEQGRSFLPDLAQADAANLRSAFIGGIVFNAANILLSAAISIAGLSVAFPVGIGLALVLGVLINYFGSAKGDPVLLFSGVALVTVAIILNAIAYGKQAKESKKVSSLGLILSLVAGLLMSFFYRFVAAAMDLEDFVNPAVGKMTPYTAMFIFALGIFVSNFLFNTLIMKKPFVGEPVDYKAYFKGGFNIHLVGILGGLIWGLGNAFNLIAAGKAGAAVSYGLGQGATLVSALWGVFIWKEFKNAPKEANKYLYLMFILFLIGIALIIQAGSN